MPDDEMLIENTLTRYGLRRMHVLRMGGAVERERWLEKVPAEALDQVQLCTWHEAALDVHHLVLVWNAREVIRLTKEILPEVCAEGDVPAVIWWIGKGWSIRGAVDAAATAFRMWRASSAASTPCGSPSTGSGNGWPARAWVQKLPLGANGSLVEVKDCSGVGAVQLVEAGWVPSGYVVVG